MGPESPQRQPQQQTQYSRQLGSTSKLYTTLVASCSWPGSLTRNVWMETLPINACQHLRRTEHVTCINVWVL